MLLAGKGNNKDPKRGLRIFIYDLSSHITSSGIKFTFS